MIDKLPDNLLIETYLNDQQVNVLIEQINRFNKLNESYNFLGVPSFDSLGNVMFCEGTLIHGIDSYNESKLDSISKTGILTGQAVGISEDCETYYCADFHRVKEDISVVDYSLSFEYNDGRCPFGKISNNGFRGDNSNSVAFVVVPDEINKDLLAYDCYRDGTYQSDVTKSFINTMPLDKDVGSSILYGVPCSCISGIVVGGRVLSDKKKIEFLIEKFPNCYILSCCGELIYDPSKRDVYSDEMIELKRENAVLKKEKRLLSKTVLDLERNNRDLQKDKDYLWQQMLVNCNSADIANVLIALGWQGNINQEYVDNMKERSGR